MAYRVAWSIVGFGVLCDGFGHDMGDRGMRGERAAVHFSHACFEKPGKDSCMTGFIRLMAKYLCIVIVFVIDDTGLLTA